MILFLLDHRHLEEHIERRSKSIGVFSGGVRINILNNYIFFDRARLSYFYS